MAHHENQEIQLANSIAFQETQVAAYNRLLNIFRGRSGPETEDPQTRGKLEEASQGIAEAQAMIDGLRSEMLEGKGAFMEMFRDAIVFFAGPKE